MVLCIFLLPVLLRLVFSESLLHWAGLDLGYFCLVILAGPVQHFRSAILDAWRGEVAANLCDREGFRGPLLDIFGSLWLLNSANVRERGKSLLRSVTGGGVWNGYLFGRVRGQSVPCRFCGVPDNDCHLFRGMHFSSSC